MEGGWPQAIQLPTGGGLQSNAFRERMKTLHYEVAPEVPFATFQECFVLLACERTGVSYYTKEDWHGWVLVGGG